MNQVDFGWWQPAGHYGQRLTWDADTHVLYRHDAAPFKGDEIITTCDEETARRIGEAWSRLGPIALEAL